MRTIKLGKTGMLVTKIGFGGIPIQRLEAADAVAVVRHAIELGINFIDTANAYTTSEENIGRAMRGQRDRLFIATKSLGRSREEVEKTLKLSLERLGVDYIDLFQFHSVSEFPVLEQVLSPGGALEAVEDARKTGLVRHVGITSHQVDVAKKAVASGRFETLMFPFNFLTPEAADDLFPLIKEQEMGFIAMKPMAGGILDNANVAVKFLLQYPDVPALVGFEKISEIEEIVQIAGGSPEMSPREKQEMAEIKKTTGSIFCHRCNYCQPCTQGIPISTVLTAKSFRKRSPWLRFIDQVDAGMQKAANCSKCGECEKRCPYHLPVTELLADLLRWYEEEKQSYFRENTGSS